MIDTSNQLPLPAVCKLGKHAPVHDPRTLKLARYLTPGLPPPPSIVDWTANLSFGMMGNDNAGDCVLAGIGHHIQVWTGNVGTAVVLSDSTIIGAYSALTGYDPRTGRNDNGTNILQALNYWKQTGVGGHKIEAYGTIDHADLDVVRQTIYLLGGVKVGVNLPLSAQGKTVWEITGSINNHNNRPGSWGGHDVPIVALDDQGNLYAVSWARIIKITSDWFAAYCDEAYGCISRDWLNSQQYAANGIDMATLTADLNAIQQS